ncbi:MAG: hypothetical protein K6F33_12415 [Bacteroidales bacterium]|nr:hypothetical protein [Bacteroidales bacterium]
MKRITLFAILLLVSFVCGCLKNEELPPPVMTISQGENEILNFSTIQSADVSVHIESGDELRKFTTITVPMSSWTDTIIVFDAFTHRADLNLSFRMWNGVTKLPKDSIFTVTYSAYTDDTVCSLQRKLRFRYVYPELDSFDVKVESAATGKCLIDVENRCAYKYSEYTNHYYDLVYVCEEDPNEGGFRTALISPDAPYLIRYFQRKFPSLLYDPAKRRSTECGVIADEINKQYTWADFNSAMLGEKNNWTPFLQINTLPPQDGVGVVDLQKTKLFKFKLDNGRYIMIKVLDRVYPQYTDQSIISLRVYMQK